MTGKEQRRPTDRALRHRRHRLRLACTERVSARDRAPIPAHPVTLRYALLAGMHIGGPCRAGSQNTARLFQSPRALRTLNLVFVEQMRIAFAHSRFRRP